MFYLRVVLSKMMNLNDKTIGLKALLRKVLAFCQFCQGMGLCMKVWIQNVENVKGG